MKTQIRAYVPASITALLLAALTLAASALGSGVAHAEDLPLSEEGKTAQSHIDSVQRNLELQRDDATAARNRALDARLAAIDLFYAAERCDAAAYNAALGKYQDALRAHTNALKDLSMHQSSHRSLVDQAMEAIAQVADEKERQQLEGNLAARTPEAYKSINEALTSADATLAEAKAKAGEAAAAFERCRALMAAAAQPAKMPPVVAVLPVPAGPMPMTAGPATQPQTPATKPCTPATARVTASVSQGAPGTLVRMTVTGFPASTPVSFIFADDAGHSRRAKDGMDLTDAQGSVTVTIAVPNVTPGPHVIRAVDGGRCQVQASVPFAILRGR